MIGAINFYDTTSCPINWFIIKWMRYPLSIVGLFAYTLLVVFQIKTTNISLAYNFTAAEIDQQVTRMNLYPSPLGRLGYILEVKKGIQLLRKFETNFFAIIDPAQYFPDKLPTVLSPFVLIGLYFFVSDSDKRRLLFNSFLLTILILSIIGPFAKYGPVLIYPYFVLFVLICFQKIFKFRLL